MVTETQYYVKLNNLCIFYHQKSKIDLNVMKIFRKISATSTEEINSNEFSSNTAISIK